MKMQSRRVVKGGELLFPDVTDVVWRIFYAHGKDAFLFHDFLCQRKEFACKKSVYLEGVRIREINNNGVILFLGSFYISSTIGIHYRKERHLFDGPFFQPRIC